MTELEFEKENKRINKFRDAQDKIYSLERKKEQIEKGVLSINCPFRDGYIKTIVFDCFGDDFKDRLKNNIVQFIDSEIEEIRKFIENI